MDPKMKANFINSISNAEENVAPAFQSIEEDTSKVAEENAPVFQALKENKTLEETSEKPDSVFAYGLPDWDIVPPQILVRRK